MYCSFCLFELYFDKVMVSWKKSQAGSGLASCQQIKFWYKNSRSHADFCHYSMSVFQQQNGYVMCRRMVCDCENPTVDLFCCPECDPRLSSQCLHQSGELSYNSGDSWIQNCQQCRCLVRLLITEE